MYVSDELPDLDPEPMVWFDSGRQVIKFNRSTCSRIDRGDGVDEGQMWRLRDGTAVVVLGNAIMRDGTRWVANNDSGATHYPPECELEKHDARDAQPIEETERKCRRWAAAGNYDAAWWLGHYYEFGGADGTPHGKSAIAYYVAHFRMVYAKLGKINVGLFDRIYSDRYDIFSASFRASQEFQPDANKVLRRFDEFTLRRVDEFTLRRVSNDWKSAIAIVEEDEDDYSQ